ncbi:hypothetical protein Pst134EA_009908 [Puccinia striiformis f. sp. tritici]|uniref:hypothetical protein n=1 Tax=Puccinia striiformis f. sp. tritici TaxID=168172 RepID=UPI0020074EDD|nr:hypothetical protein Pst134EA_009908 [Puccinia striiformis f. sp. tritici]KAH9469387.1 hypothetical protein Pst134EA_009908 [Puccinia striiformis f. sp. tritici]
MCIRGERPRSTRSRQNPIHRSTIFFYLGGMIEQTAKTRQLITLISSVSIALSAGTNYAFSIYSVQLGHRLKLSSTTLNLIGIAGNLGMYISSPIVGRIIDRYGTMKPLLVGMILISIGYNTLHELYMNPETRLKIVLTSMGNMLIGIGSSIANSCAITGTASVFDSKYRATAMGTVLAGFGLSAFFWTSLASMLVSSEDTASLLKLLSIGPSIAILIGISGYFFVGLHHHHSRVDHHHHDPLEDTQLLSNPHPDTKTRDVSGWALVKEVDFWMIWIVMSCCCGIGLMIINNLGTMIVAISGSSPSDPTNHQTIRKYQSHAVSILSIFNCLGRIFAGTLSDLMKRKIAVGRVWWLSWISSLFLLSQILGYFMVDRLEEIVWLGALVGFSYGNMYGTAPALVLEWFGLKHFATNFGFLNLAPLLCGQIFNLSFGKIFDSNSHHHSTSSSFGNDDELVCDLHQDCYRSVFGVTILCALVSLSLSMTLGFRRPEFNNISSPRANSKLVSSTDDDEHQPILIRSSTEDI